ncbi:hypothetical protein C2S52_002437 [Perilla frutescens var. hirtella]|nr:hypothetical protein C2S51_012985 [Perilla frutescens var. frutescens]KAH6791960.1 hypothetical protein C2S52_002437 [Perilla frutescens var. hirtella]
MGKPHVVAVPYPAQGHVIPMMEVAQCLANSGVRVTFVNTEFNHSRVMKALADKGNVHELISLASVPDGLESQQDRNDHGRLAEATLKIIPEKLQALIQEMNGTHESDEVTCVLADFYMSSTLQAAEKLCIKRAVFMPASVAMLALTINAGKLVDDGIIDSNGTPFKEQQIQLSPTMPDMNTMHFAWTCFPDVATRKVLFESILENNRSAEAAEWLICNSSHELEPGALSFIPNCLPIGPLLSSSRLVANFWPEDSTCLSWLDQQQTNSVIYVAFGSFTIFDTVQFQELALGLELTSRPFLWVVRQDTTQEIEQAYPEGFRERVMSRGKIVEWAPQQQVLSHPSIAGFISHCGWNSTIEGMSNGVPFLCWPYFADQFLNQTYIVHHWEVGLALAKDEGGIIRQGEIKNKALRILDDASYKTRALKLQAKAIASVGDGGSSQKNFHNFVDWIQGN